MNSSILVKNWDHRILPYLFVNALFNGHLIGSGFTKFGYENDKLFI